MKALIAAIALATLIAVPTFAQPANAAPVYVPPAVETVTVGVAGVTVNVPLASVTWWGSSR